MDALDEVIRDVRPPEVESAGFQLEVPPWAESYEISATDMDGKRYNYNYYFIIHCCYDY